MAVKIKKVLLVSDFAFPVKAGTERLVFGLAKYINQSKKFQADILCPQWNDQIKERQVVDGITIHSFPTHAISQTKPLKRIKDFVSMINKLPAYDIYHGFYTVPPLAATVIASKLKRKKSVITFFSRDKIDPHMKNPLKKFLLLSLFRLADRITTYTWILEKRFKELYFPKKELTTIQGWSETMFKKIKTKKEKENIILFVGRINESKGVYVLIKSFSKIFKQIKAKLVLIGPAYEKEKAEKMIKEKGLAKKVKLLGFVSNQKLNEWYNKADLVAVPPLHPDGFGLSLMEAIICGKPVVCTASIGAPENYPELIVEPGNEKQLSELMLKFFTDKKFKKKYIESYNKMATLFDRKTVLDKYLNLYENVIKR